MEFIEVSGTANVLEAKVSTLSRHSIMKISTHTYLTGATFDFQPDKVIEALLYFMQGLGLGWYWIFILRLCFWFKHCTWNMTEQLSCSKAMWILDLTKRHALVNVFNLDLYLLQCPQCPWTMWPGLPVCALSPWRNMTCPCGAGLCPGALELAARWRALPPTRPLSATEMEQSRSGCFYFFNIIRRLLEQHKHLCMQWYHIERYKGCI